MKSRLRRRRDTTGPEILQINGDALKELISHQLVKYLEDRGVGHIFGLCGHTNIAVLTALEKSSIRFFNTRHEQVAAHTANGYARAKETSVSSTT